MENNNDEKQIIGYLLGDLDEDQQKRVEERLLTSDEYYELLLMAENDLIEDYVEGALSDREQEKFEAHFLCSPERREKIRFAMTLRNYVSAEIIAERQKVVSLPDRPSWWKPLISSSAFGLAAAAIIVIALGLGTWRAFIHKSESNTGLAALNSAYREQRPTEARITGLNYAPLAPITRGGEPQKFDYVARDRAGALIQGEVAEHPGAQSYHDLGRFYLANHEYDKAIDQFKSALKADSNNAQLHSDLGAAYLERAVAGGDKSNITDLADSLEQFNQAIKIDDSLLAAYFNKALCLQRMDAIVSAREAWNEYIKKDADSEWSKEAERNLKRLEGQGINNKKSEEVFQDFLTAFRKNDRAQAWRIQSQTKEMITGTMIPFQLAQRLLEANLTNQTEASEEISEAFRFAGELEKIQSHDPFFAELAGYYSTAGKKNVTTLKQAQVALQQAYRLCLQGRYGEARQPFETARNLFLLAGNIWESRVVDYWRAYCLSYAGELKKSLSILWSLAQYCQARHYHWLESQSYTWLANNSALIGEYSEGVEQDKKALNITKATGDLYGMQKTSSQIATDYKFLGRLGEALEFNRLSLPSADAYFVSYRQYWRSLFSITDTLFALRLHAAAEAYQQEALQLALNHFDDPALTHDTYLRLGQIYAGQGNYSASAQALDLSLKTLQPIESDPIYKKLCGLSMLQLGNLKRQMGDGSAALEYYQQAAQKFEASEFNLYDYNTHKGILLCYLLNKDDQAIQKEMLTVLSLFEQNRQRIKEEQNRNHFFDAEQDVYELAIDYEHARNNKEQSFHYAELSRARSLQDAIIGGSTASNDSMAPDVEVPAVSQPLTLNKLQERLPANLRLVEYAVLQNRLLIWFMTNTRFEVIEQPVSITTLEAAADEYLQVLPRSDPDSLEREKRLAAELYDWLFAPLENYLDTADEVALVPDKFLFKVPFAALLSRQSGQRIVENYRLLYAPSATILILCSDIARMKPQDKQAERLLSVGGPVLTRQQLQVLPDLPSAVFEANKIAPFYQSKAIYVRNDALKEKILPELRQSDVIHFATHYVPDDFFPAKSRLVFTAGSEQRKDDATADLTLQEIQTMRLFKAKVAILSACRSGIERYYAGEGLIGLSRAFLAARIPLVIASQWAVESDSTADLMIRFHKFRKEENMPTTEALRNAQLAMLRHEDERYRQPYYWAAFFPIGGHASY